MSSGKIYLEQPIIQATGEETGTPIPATTGTAAVTLQPFSVRAQGTYTVGEVPYTGKLEFINKAISATSGSESSITGSFPLNAYNGNLLIATMVTKYLLTEDAVVPPPGWSYDGYYNNGNPGDEAAHVFTKIASNEPLSWTWNFTSGGLATLTVTAFAGPTDRPLDKVGKFRGATASLNLTFPNETVFYLIYNDQAFDETKKPTLPVGFTELSDQNVPFAKVGYKSFDAAGPTGDMTGTTVPAGTTSVLVLAYEAVQQGTNYAPVAIDGSLATSKNAVFDGSLIASDVNDDSLTYLLASQPTNGIVNITDSATGAYNYTPNLDFTGSDSFTFKVNDGTVDSNVATVTISVTAPTTDNISFEVTEGRTYTGTLVGADDQSNPITFSIVNQPSKGTVTITDTSTGAFTYTADGGVTGADSFTFKVNNGFVDSNVSTASVSILALTPPVAEDSSFSVTVSTSHTGMLVATDVNNDPLTYSIVSQPTNGAVVLNDVNTGNFTYTPTVGYLGPDSFTFKANDGTADSNVATVSADVTSDVYKVIAKDGSGDYTTIGAFLADVPADLSAATGVGQRWIGQLKKDNYTGVVAPARRVTDSEHYIKLMAYPGDEHLGVPGAGVNFVLGNDSVAFSIQDDYFEIWDMEVSGANLATSYYLEADGTIEVRVYNAINSAKNFISFSTGGFKCYNCLSYLNTDGRGFSRESTGEFYNCTGIGNLSGNSLNTPGIRDGKAVNCVVMNFGIASTFNDYEGLVAGSGNNIANDTSGDLQAAMVDTFVSPVGPVPDFNLLEAATARDFGVGPDADPNIPDFDIAYRPRTGLTTDAGAFMFVVHVPVAQDGSFSLDMNTSHSGTLLATDEDNDVLTYSVVTPPTHGIVNITNVNTGAFIYTPTQGYSGPDSFTFKANDGTTDSNTAVESITVNQIVYDAVLDNALQPVTSTAEAVYTFKDVFATIAAALAPVESTATATYAFKDVFAAIDVSLQPVQAEIHTQFIPENQLPVDVKARYSLQAVFEPRHKITTAIPG